MHYRFYKMAIQDCKAIINMLENEPLSLTRRLWVSGIISDLIQRVKEEHILDYLSRVKRDLTFVLASDLIDSIQHILVLLQQSKQIKLRIDLLFARPVSSTYLLHIYNQLSKHDFVDVRIIAIDYYPATIYKSSGQYNELVTFLSSKNVNYVSQEKYDVFEEMPDLIFYSFHNHIYMKPLQLQHSSLTPIINRTMFLEYSLTPTDILVYNSDYTINPYTWLQFRTSEFSYNSVKWGEQDIVTGHPLMDLSYEMYEGNMPVKIPEEWEAVVQDTTVILWNINPILNTDNSINSIHTRKKVEDTLKIINDICIQYHSITIILRPHPLTYLGELQDKFRKSHKRVILDRNPDSYPALFIADAYIGDYGSLYSQFLPSKRPALLFDVSHYDCNYIFWSQMNLTSNINDTYTFVENLLTNYSSLVRPITKIDTYCLGPIDGKSSERISDAIISKFIDEESSFIREYCATLTNIITNREPIL